MGLGDRPLGVEAQPGVHFGRDPAGDDFDDLTAGGGGGGGGGGGEADKQVVHEGFGLRGLIAPFLGGVLERPARPSGRTRRLLAALNSNEGLVVASWGLNLAIELMSPVSATTVVYFLSESKRDMTVSFGKIDLVEAPFYKMSPSTGHPP